MGSTGKDSHPEKNHCGSVGEQPVSRHHLHRLQEGLRLYPSSEDDEDPEIDSNASGVELPSMNRWDQIETRRSLVQSDADDDSCSLPDSHHDVSNNIRNNNIYNP